MKQFCGLRRTTTKPGACTEHSVHVQSSEFSDLHVELYAFTCTMYSMVENCGMSSAGWFTSDMPAYDGGNCEGENEKTKVVSFTC